jgi:hypothetical protein
MTRFGQIEVVEQLYRKKSDNVQVRPFSLAAGVRNRSFSLGLQRALTDFGSEESFERASERVGEHYGVEVGASSVRRITGCHAEAMGFELETDVRMPANGVKELLVETDGVFVPIVEIKGKCEDKRKSRSCVWREARLSLAGQVGSTVRQYQATLGDVKQSGRCLTQAVVEAGAGRNTLLHCVADGAAWIVKQVKEQFGEQASFLLDFYHLSEYLSTASEGISGTLSGKQWFEVAKEKMKKNEVSFVLEELKRNLEEERVLDSEAPVRRCVRYMESRLDYLDYATAIERGFPIGSGEIESSNKTVIQKRLKIAGAWWKKENAEKMLALRCTRANQEWESYWKAQRQAHA